jgi:membrane-bound serine protease (ClpP class)
MGGHNWTYQTMDCRLLFRRFLWWFVTPVIVAVLAAWSAASVAVAADAPDDQAPAPAAAPAAAAAVDAPPRDTPAGAVLGEGCLIQVRLPLVGNADAHVKTAIQRALAQLANRSAGRDRRPVLILELAPARRHTGAGEGTEFERARSLARYLMRPEMAAVKTVAYIPRTIKGHGVLVALACEEIVMAPEAEIGDAGIDEDSRLPVDQDIVSSYQFVAKARLTVPEAIVLSMLDPRLEALKVETDRGTEFVLRDELDALKGHTTVVSEQPLVPSGSLGSFTGREGREYGFVKLLASDRDALARDLALPPEAVVEDQSLVGDWRPVMINIDGPITARVVHQVETLIGTELKDRKVNWIGLRIDSDGGQLEDCLRLAQTLAELDQNDVLTVAYVPVEASGGAALVALACDQLVMQPDAHLGGKNAVDLDRDTLDSAGVTIRDSLADVTDHGWSLLAAMIDPDLEVFTYHNAKTGEIRYLSEQEAAKQHDANDWQRGPRITADGEPLRLASNRAEEMDLAWQVVDNFDELKQLYGFEADPRVAVPNWALELVEALGSPALTMVLIALGMIGIYVELQTPGVGIGGFVSALAFMLLFWSKYLNGTAGWLEALLFVGGLFFLLLEMFVLPGFGIFGLGGAVMVLSSLVLASMTVVIPQTESQLAELRSSLTVVIGAIGSVVILAMALRHYLPHTPLLRKLLLNPPAEEELADLDYREAVAEFSYLVGQQGVATTNLMPSGKADFDGRLLDVIAEGMPIDRGRTIVVVKARGNRVLVRPVDA